MTDWFDNEQAMREGWAVSQTSGTDDERDARVERLDELEKFETDAQAWAHVLRCANEMSIYHVNALRFVFERNASEKAAILAYAYGENVPVPEEGL